MQRPAGRARRSCQPRAGILKRSTCAACRDGKYNLCDSLGFVGLSGGHGGFAAYSVVPARMVHKMPEGLSMEQGALVEPAAVSALESISVRKPDSIER